MRRGKSDQRKYDKEDQLISKGEMRYTGKIRKWSNLPTDLYSLQKYFGLTIDYVMNLDKIYII